MFIFVFAAIGGTIFYYSRAATLDTSQETEAGSITGNAVQVTDNTASGGNAVKFGAASGTGFTVPCGLTAAAGAGTSEANGSIDTTSCWATHTGVQNGTGYSESQILAGQSNLAHITGDVTINTPGTTIDHEWIDGCVMIDANNVTIKNSLIHTQHLCEAGDDGTDASAVNNGHYTVFNTLVQDTTVDGMNAGNDLSRGLLLGYGSKMLRDNVYGFVFNAWTDGNAQHPSEIVDSYSHGLDNTWASNGTPSTPHENALYLNSSSYVTVEHDYVSAVRAGQSVTGAIDFLGSFGPPANDTIDSSYAEGGDGTDVYVSCGQPNIHVTNNALSNDNGYNGTLTIDGFMDGNGNVWSGNFVPETSQSYADPSPDGC